MHGVIGQLLANWFTLSRTLVSVDADASLRKFQNSEGVDTTSLSLHQRTFFFPSPLF
jgi:hypothetical protein